MNRFYDSVAVYYDRLWGDQADAADELTFLRELAGTGPALEIGIGTGRVAVPLAATGIRVVGVDPSPKMLEVLNQKVLHAPHLRVHSSLGDMSLTGISERFSLVYCVYHTLFCAGSRQEQQMFFHRALALLTGNGVIVVEAYVPSEKRRARWARGLHTLDVSERSYDYELYRHDEAAQTVCIGRNTYDGNEVHYSYWEERYLTPPQIDDLATRAGLEMRERWRSFRRDPFDESSGRCVSVYGPSAAGSSVD